MTPHPTSVKAARAILSYSEATGADLDSEDVRNIAEHVEESCHVSEMVEALQRCNYALECAWSRHPVRNVDEVIAEAKSLLAKVSHER